MLAWLGEWLQSIVVVVLLAIVVELVLPNNKMLRYSRLVVGLILLLTVLNPILQLFQVNLQEKLNASYSLWEKEAQAKGNSLPSLQQITEQAEQLKQKREEAALEMTKTSIEQAIESELKRSTSAFISQVSVALGWSETSKNQSLPYIEAVTVTVQEQQDLSDSEAIKLISPVEIDEVNIPLVEIDNSHKESIEQHKQATKERQQETLDSNGQRTEQFRQQAQEIVSIIASGWNVRVDHIYVQQAAND